MRGVISFVVDVGSPGEPADLLAGSGLLEVPEGHWGLREYRWQLAGVLQRGARVFDQLGHPLAVLRFLVLVADPIHLCVHDYQIA